MHVKVYYLANKNIFDTIQSVDVIYSSRSQPTPFPQTQSWNVREADFEKKSATRVSTLSLGERGWLGGINYVYGTAWCVVSGQKTRTTTGITTSVTSKWTHRRKTALSTTTDRPLHFDHGWIGARCEKSVFQSLHRVRFNFEFGGEGGSMSFPGINYFYRLDSIKKYILLTKDIL